MNTCIHSFIRTQSSKDTLQRYRRAERPHTDKQDKYPQKSLSALPEQHKPQARAAGHLAAQRVHQRAHHCRQCRARRRERAAAGGAVGGGRGGRRRAVAGGADGGAQAVAAGRPRCRACRGNGASSNAQRGGERTRTQTRTRTRTRTQKHKHKPAHTQANKHKRAHAGTHSRAPPPSARSRSAAAMAL